LIPKTIHRVHMGPENDSVKYCWESAKKHNPDWKFVTHNEKSSWPIVGNYLNYSKTYAYKSDLMRLEALYHYGGIYLDTDVEIIRSLDHFTEYNYPFAAWESPYVIGSAVIGAPPKNDEILSLIAYCIGSIILEADDGKIDYSGERMMFSPTVITKLWKSNSEVRLLSPESFYPYHWSEKDRSNEDFLINENTFGVHHWNGSWSH
jgi:mannosyltransferase OCH1-like enzyme